MKTAVIDTVGILRTAIVSSEVSRGIICLPCKSAVLGASVRIMASPTDVAGDTQGGICFDGRLNKKKKKSNVNVGTYSRSVSRL